MISYASHALTPVEQRYSQTEREALAVVFGCERYHLYVMGSRFTVVTDHNNPQSNQPARIERWTLRLQRYDMTVVYRPGKDKPCRLLIQASRPLSESLQNRDGRRGVCKLCCDQRSAKSHHIRGSTGGKPEG